VSRKHFLFLIQSRPWLIQPEFAYSAAPIIQRLLDGKSAYHDDGDDEEKEVNEASRLCFSQTREGHTSFGSKYNPFENAAPGSTAVIGISGPIMKYDNCGDPGTRTYGHLFKKAEVNPNINSILLVIDSPGGTVDGTVDLASIVANHKKPVVALVDGMMASAAYWIGSAADHIMAGNKTADIGSIGTMMSFVDVQPYWEKQGVKFHYVYADASKDKNKDFHDLQEGKYDLIKADLNKINDEFVGAVKSNRPGVKQSALSGKMFLADEAISQGLIDAIGTFDDAVNKAQDLARNTDSSATKKAELPIHIPQKNSQNADKMKVTLTTAHAALLALCGVSIAAGQASVEVELDALNAAVDKQAKDLKKAQDDAAAVKTELTTAKTDLTTAQAEIAKLKPENPGSKNAKKEGEDTVETADASEAEVWNLPHNKAALNSPMFSK
jgi:signal peptide peptidase SppA